MSDENHNNGFWLGLMVGGVLGAAASYYAATEDKEALRKKLIEKGKVLLDNLDELGANVEKKGEELKEEVIEKVAELGQRIELPGVVEAAGENAVEKPIAKLSKPPKKFFFRKK